MQTRRHLVAWDCKTDRVHFTWAAHTTSTRALTAGEMDQEIAQELARWLQRGQPTTASPAHWITMASGSRHRRARNSRPWPSAWGGDLEVWRAYPDGSLEQVPRADATTSDRERYVFPDNSVIVVHGDGWDHEGDAPGTWCG